MLQVTSLTKDIMQCTNNSILVGRNTMMRDQGSRRKLLGCSFSQFAHTNDNHRYINDTEELHSTYTVEVHALRRPGDSYLT